jgi:hypothetical protein
MALLAVALALAVTPARAAPQCTTAAAKAAILRSPLPTFIKDVTRGKFGTGPGAGGPRIAFCADLTRDGRPDMVVPFASGGTAGDVAWFVFRATPSGWRLALERLKLYKIGVTRAGGDVVETQPVYRRDDPNCCPTGGFDHVRFHWNGSRFTVVRKWHDRRPR